MGKNPNTGQDVNDWHCAISWGPLLQVEVANQVRQDTATVDALREEVQQVKEGMRNDFRQFAAVIAAAVQDQSFRPRQIGNGVSVMDLPMIEAAPE